MSLSQGPERLLSYRQGYKLYIFFLLLTHCTLFTNHHLTREAFYKLPVMGNHKD